MGCLLFIVIIWEKNSTDFELITSNLYFFTQGQILGVYCNCHGEKLIGYSGTTFYIGEETSAESRDHCFLWHPGIILDITVSMADKHQLGGIFMGSSFHAIMIHHEVHLSGKPFVPCFKYGIYYSGKVLCTYNWFTGRIEISYSIISWHIADRVQMYCLIWN